jgi:hypothetical protein
MIRLSTSLERRAPVVACDEETQRGRDHETPVAVTGREEDLVAVDRVPDGPPVSEPVGDNHSGGGGTGEPQTSPRQRSLSYPSHGIRYSLPFLVALAT